MIAPTRGTLRSEEGFTLVELAIAALVGGLMLTLVAGFLIGAQRTGIFAQDQVTSLNEARNAVGSLAKEIRGAERVEICEQDGGCLELTARTPTGGTETVRYTYADGVLRRELYDDADGTWGPAQSIVDGVANTSSEPVFACDTERTFLRVAIDLRIEPASGSGQRLNARTSARPRNFSPEAVCP